MEQDVFWFEVTVDDVVVMHVFNCSADLPDVLFYCLLVHSTVLLQILVEILTETGLHNQIGRVLVDEEVV